MRVEQVNGRYLLCGGIISADQVKPGQVWAAADGSDRTVLVEGGDALIEYSWMGNGEKKTHIKSNFGFQCRYCLVLESNEIPEELK